VEKKLKSKNGYAQKYRGNSKSPGNHVVPVMKKKKKGGSGKDLQKGKVLSLE